MLSHINLAVHYKIMFTLAQHHKWSLSELESLIPYERDLYIDMLNDYIESKSAT